MSQRASSQVRKSTKKKRNKKSSKSDFWDLSHIKTKVDNKTPAFSIEAYYKPTRLENDAEVIAKIDAENFELLTKLNTIHRSGGLSDCWNREFKYSSALFDKKSNFKKIAKENQKFAKKLEKVKGEYDTVKLIEEYKNRKAAKEAEKKANDSTSPKISKKISLKKTPEDLTRARCYFEIEIPVNHRKLGKIVFQLFTDVVPKTCDNFLSFCRGSDKLSYTGTPFHRIVPGYWCQGGDVLKFNGAGETSIYGDTFEDENLTLKHSERGILSTCGFEKNANTSKFNLTFDKLEAVDGKRVVFGKVIGGMSTLAEIERYGTRNGKPTMKIIVSKCGVL